MSNNKHMNAHDRIIIENSLDAHDSFKTVAKKLNKDCTTISKEVKKNSVERNTCSVGRNFNNCIHRDSCQLSGVCDECINQKCKFCKSCNQCRKECSEFVEEVCSRLSNPPYVCNGCPDRNKCRLSKKLYHALEANKSYKKRLSDSRKGFSLDESDIERLNNIFTPLAGQKKQSIHHIFINHSDEIMISEKTLYKIIDAGLLKIRNIDLPRQVTMRKRSTASKKYKVDKKCLEGRRYEDYLIFMEKHPDYAVVQIDSVEGKKGESCLLTIHFTVCSFMIAIKREFNDSKSVTDYFNELYKILGKKLFRKLFFVILTDNGSEFSNPKAIEFDEEGNRRTYVFYCHPSAPYEKGACEVNHELLRRIVPKGKSWNQYTQKDISLMMSHINSYARAKLNDKSPHLLFSTLYGNEVSELLCITRIDADDINLSPTLLSKNK